jgi:hypothetical protein
LAFLASAACRAPRQAELTFQQTATLDSLRQVDDWPLYVMHYRGPYDQAAVQPEVDGSAWACSLVAALGDPDNLLYGRSFDWRHSPALLLFTDPDDAYASVSMVDLTYAGLPTERAAGLEELPLEERRDLLRTPWLPIDGMNERGLAIGMAAVSPGDVPDDPDKETIGSLGVMREVLDHAATVDEALALLDRYNIDFGGGPPLHYLIADRGGRAALVEFYQGKRIVHHNPQPWLHATNFLVSEQGTRGRCDRYDELAGRLRLAQGAWSPDEAMEALSAVAQPNTQWSITYNLSTGQVQVAMGRGYDEVYTFRLEVGE